MKRLGKTVIYAIVATLSLLSAGYGRIRVHEDYSRFINPDSVEPIASIFIPGPGSLFRSVGGVILDGSAVFYAETSSATVPIMPSQIQLDVEGGDIFLNYDNNLFAIEIHQDLACPLGRFVRRGGIIAFTLPPMHELEDVMRLSNEGVVFKLMQFGYAGEFVVGYAREFVDTPFENLFFGMDFLDTVPLTDELSNQIIENVSTAAGLTQDSMVNREGSYINSDQQVEYQVYLVVENSEVDVAGMPLKYHWDWQEDRQPRIQKVEGWSSVFDRNRIATSDEIFGQYDYINTAQVAGIFRELSRDNPMNFSDFVDDACGGR